MKPVKAYLLLFVLLAPMVEAFSQKNRVSQAVEISSESPTVPLIKGLHTNPLLRVRIYVPENAGSVSYRSIGTTLNEAAVRNIQYLNVFYTGSEALFNSKERLDSLSSLSSNSSFAFNKELKPGIHYLWFSARLKEDADMDAKPEFRVRSLESKDGKAVSVKEESKSYVKRTAIAIRKAGDDDVHTYRIPGIITTDKGTLIAVYDIRYINSSDLPGNIDVGMSRSTDGGKSWEPMKVIMDMGAPHENNGVGDPSILFDPVTKKIWVSALWSKGNRSIAGSKPGLSPDETGQFAMVSSSDDGLSWTKPYSITEQVKNPAWKLFFPGPGNGIAMRDGKLVFPAQYWDADHMPHSTLIYSEDHGASWKSGTGAKRNTTESQLIETSPGELMLNMRDNRGKFRSVAITKDLGQTWVEHRSSYKALPDPVCMASIIKAPVTVKGKSGDWVFFSNVNSQRARVDMTVKASPDLGETWPDKYSLLIDENPLYGYSALTRIDENTIGLLYEGIRDLYFIRIPVKEIIK